MDYYCPVSSEQPSEPKVDGRSLRAGRVRGRTRATSFHQQLNFWRRTVGAQ